MIIDTTMKTLLITGASAGLMQPAIALEAEDFVDRVEEVYRELGFDLEFGQATLDGDTVIVEGLTANLVSTPDAEGVSTDKTFTFSGVTEREDGSYLVDRLTVPDLDAPISAEPPGNVTLAEIQAEGLYLPAGKPDDVDRLQLIKSVSTGALTITRQGEDAITMESLDATLDFVPEQGSPDLSEVTSELRLEGVWADLIVLNDVMDENASRMLRETGLKEIKGNIIQSMAWSPESGRFTIEQFLFDFDDQGALNVAFDVMGLTPELVAQAHPLNTKSPDTSSTAATEPSNTMQGMSLLENIEVISASVQYDDESLVDNAIEFYAEKAGANRAAYVTWLQAQAADFLVAAGVTPLADMLKPAIENFLSDPQSFRLSIHPSDPKSLLEVMGEASNPEGITTRLGVAVEANRAPKD